MKRKRFGRENSKLPSETFCLPLGEVTVCVNVDLPECTVFTKSRSSSVAVACAEAATNAMLATRTWVTRDRMNLFRKHGSGRGAGGRRIRGSAGTGSAGPVAERPREGSDQRERGGRLFVSLGNKDLAVAG